MTVGRARPADTRAGLQVLTLGSLCAHSAFPVAESCDWMWALWWAGPCPAQPVRPSALLFSTRGSCLRISEGVTPVKWCGAFMESQTERIST